MRLRLIRIPIGHELLPTARSLRILPKPAMTRVLKCFEKVKQTSRQAFDQLAGMAIFGQEKWQLQIGLLFQLNDAIVLLQHFVGRVLGYGYQIVAQLNTQLWFVRCQDVIAQQEVDLKRVERKAVGADDGQVHDVVFGRLEEKGGLDDA